MTSASRHRVGIDIGGTFTDVVVLTANGDVEVLKVPSTPPAFENAILGAVEQLEALGHRPGDMAALAHGTTVATNAVLERRGARVVLLTTKGFRDILELGQMRRPGLVDPDWEKPAPIVPRRDRIEVDERVDANGNILQPINRDEIEGLIGRLAEAESIAICFMHSYINPEHERAARDILREHLPEMPISISSDILPELGEYERLSTTVVNAYVQPVIEKYFRTLADGLESRGAGREVRIMQSNGSLCGSSAAARKPVTIIESGPAAGVAAAAALAKRLELSQVLTFDMGGTTAKASLVEDGRPLEASKYEVGGGMNSGRLLSAGGGYLIGAPSIDIAEVGAGGGSQFWIDGAGHPQVGPESSGAMPGPVCYGLGGTVATVTDANLLLGYLSPEGLAGNTRAVSAEAAFNAVKSQAADPLGISVDDAAFGIYQIANSAMVRALRAVSSERGRDPREFTLVAFGGCGPLHAVALAREIEAKAVIVPARAGLFSAVGLLDAHMRQDFMQPWLRPLSEGLNEGFESLESRARTELAAELTDAAGIQYERLLDVRYAGQASYLTLPVEGPHTDATVDAIRKRFDEEYELTYGHSMPADPVEVVNLRVRATLPSEGDEGFALAHHEFDDPIASLGRTRNAYFGPEHGRIDSLVLGRADLQSTTVRGPVLVDDMDTTTVVPPNCLVSLDSWGNLVIVLGSGDEEASVKVDADEEGTFDLITGEVIRNALTSLADEMAVTVVRTARSQIVRDTMDFSTAILDGQGRLVSLGLTLLLQLGSLPEVIETIQTRFAGDINPGDIFIGNDPSEGGLHTPDVYLLKPVFLGEEIVAWTAVIAQHADVGGLAAGSTSPAARNIFQEGLQIPFIKLYDREVLNDPLTAVILRNTRVPEIVWSDLCAQRAACEKGEAGIRALIDRYGNATLAGVMNNELDSTESLIRAELRDLPDGRYEFVDQLDDDGFGSGPIEIAVAVTIDGDSVKVDFDGTSEQVTSALNSTMSFTRAGVYAALVWSLGRRENLNNAGMFRAVEVTAPEGTVVNGRRPAPRGARGTTGFRIIDAVLGALHKAVPGQVPAAGEGGLSVVSFGGENADGSSIAFNDIFSAGWGARPNKDGIDGTSPIGANLASTPAEMIERHHPVRMDEYTFVPDSGGAGQFRGGLAIKRTYTFLGERGGDLQVRSDRKVFRPYGLEGGEPGGASQTLLTVPGHETVELSSKVTMEIVTDAQVTQITAGCGGYGDPKLRDPESVLQDVIDGKVTIGAAADVYGVEVVLDGSTPVEARRNA